MAAAQPTATTSAPEKKLTKSDLRRAWWIWTFFNLSAFSMERMQAPAFVYMMSPIIRRLYGHNPEEVRQALQRHMVFFNTEPQTGVIAGGVGATVISLKTPLAYTSGQLTIKFQDTLDKIFPQFLALGLVLLLWYGMRRRGWPINRALMVVLAVTFVGFLPNLLGQILG